MSVTDAATFIPRKLRKPRQTACSERFVRSRYLSSRLLYFRFLESNVLAGNRVVLPERQLLSRRPGVLLRNVEEAGSGRAQQLDLLDNRLGHGGRPSWWRCVPNLRAWRAL